VECESLAHRVLVPAADPLLASAAAPRARWFAIRCPAMPTTNTFAPLAPEIFVPPTQVADDTFVLHQVQPALGAPLFVYINSMVILGEQPMIVDTSTPANREQFLEEVFTLVDPEAVKWVYLSHDDVDHAGNLDEVLTACPNAQLVCTW